MIKLTAEKCRNHIDRLTDGGEQRCLSIYEEDYLQALEIALPVLEQQGWWINCTERMPTDGKAVIVCSRQGKVQDMNYFWAYGKWWPVSEDDDSAPEGEFSHWQPLPAPPHNQPTTPQIDNDGWMEWGGGKQPIANDRELVIKFRDGTVMSETHADCWAWSHSGDDDDIIAYRVVQK